MWSFGVPNVPCGVERKVLYENNVFLSSVKKEEPFGVSTFLKGSITPGLRKSYIL
jgi:hypothetical protein